jgi:hypothetical protein
MCSYDPICWTQLRFFPSANTSADAEGRSVDSRTDALYDPSVTSDQIRVQLDTDLLVTCYYEPGSSRKLKLKLSPIEFRLNEEQADVWLAAVCTASTALVNHRAVIDTLNRIKQLWDMEQSVFEECASSDGLFLNCSSPKPHLFEFTITNQAKASLCTVPVSWKLTPEPSASEVFVSRCRLVQDRLNAVDMLASPLPLQFAFLRKLVH